MARGLRVHRGGRLALHDVDLDLPRGTTTALVGPNGSGKTTLLHALCALVATDAGDVDVLGRPVRAHRRDVAVVLQQHGDARPLPVTVREVVRAGRWSRLGLLRRLRAADHAAVDRAMQRLDVADLADRHLGELSGGQRQRVLVAQALAQEAELLLLDEPVSGLDLPSERRIAEVLRAETAEGRTVVVATHDLDEALAADAVVLLAGHVVAHGPPAEVLTPQHLRQAYGARLDDPGLLGHVDHHRHL